MLRTFRAQLVVSFFLVIVVTPMLFVGLFYTTLGRYLRGGGGPSPVGHHARALGSVVQEELAAGRGTAEVERLLRASVPGTPYRLILLDPARRVLVDTALPAGTQPDREPYSAEALRRLLPFGGDPSKDDGHPHNRAAVALVVDGRPGGALVVYREGSNWSLFTPTGLATRSLIGLLMAGVLGLFLSRRLLRPVDQLTRAAEAMAAGDLSQRVAVPPEGELGRLAERFNTMAARVEELVTRLSTEHQRLLAAHEELAQSERRQRELIANVSHELRTPLACVRASVEAILDGVANDEARRERCLRAIEDEAGSLSRLVDDLLTLSRIDSGELPIRLGVVDVGRLLERCSNAFLARAEGQGVVLTWHCAEGATVLGDEARLAQVLGNVVDNALRYTGPGGRVSLNAEMDGDLAEIGVADTGSGIPPEHLPHIFERLYRAEKSRSKGSGGAGLGLAIAREIVEAHGGTIAAESAPGCGTSVVIRVPAGRRSPVPTPELAAA